MLGNIHILFTALITAALIYLLHEKFSPKTAKSKPKFSWSAILQALKTKSARQTDPFPGFTPTQVYQSLLLTCAAYKSPGGKRDHSETLRGFLQGKGKGGFVKIVTCKVRDVRFLYGETEEDGVVYVAFRGTADFWDVKADLNVIPKVSGVVKKYGFGGFGGIVKLKFVET